MFISIRIAKVSQKEFIGQWDWTGKLNGHIEEMFTGHSVVRVFGRRRQSQETFENLNEEIVNYLLKINVPYITHYKTILNGTKIGQNRKKINLYFLPLFPPDASVVLL